MSTLNRSSLARPATSVADKVVMDPQALPGIQTSASVCSSNAETPLQLQQSHNANQNPTIPSMSWADLDTAVRSSGECWVIGPGNAIIDIRQWITTHPGGQTILLDSIGTSIVRDVFPMPSPPVMSSGISAEEWLHISASRRESEHSTQALDKMRNMVIGYIKPSPGVLPGQFDPLEYRRYALVRKETTSGPGATRATFLIGLAELYPSGAGAPAFFLPGHVIEIRMRVSKSAMRRLATSNPQTHERIPSSGWISRYYTPISGSMSRFDITVKLVTNGAMSYLLQRLSPSEYPQVQVRGPFGTPLINPERPLPCSNGCWDHVVMLCAGSGSVAALQFASWMFLNSHFPGSLHRPVGTLQPGTPVLVHRSSNEPGQVTITAPGTLHERQPIQAPLTSITPWVGNCPRLTVLCAESDYASITGRNMFDSISSAYPSQFQVHYRTDSLPPTNRIPNITLGSMTPEYIQKTLMTRCDPASTHFVMCGPKRFVDECYSVLEEIVEASNITCLPPHTYLSRPMPPFLKDGADAKLSVRMDARGMQLWFVRSGEKATMAVAANEAVKQPSALA
ncbi:hypothetical protein BCR44DRAFT_49029 [Catenaria anguillulae PL171]|uniref:Cytochrome b5 heme-binding domain-containing protein n=1 Tax=Catenaria anguillulae PL171 TaxID=765915 RepID=A0A1Y2HUX6_9FUNG|nr:hypothetical protein BCR44DRAFT_49029 [Catenaria anguillulae PL171]